MMNFKKIAVDLREIVMIFVAVLLGSSLLPTALASWYAATDTGGALESAPAGFIAIWEFVPYGVALAMFLMVAYVAINKFKSD